jgi:hypothetical protein
MDADDDDERGRGGGAVPTQCTARLLAGILSSVALAACGAAAP